MKLSTKSALNYNSNLYYFIITIKGTASIKILNKKKQNVHITNQMLRCSLFEHTTSLQIMLL